MAKLSMDADKIKGVGEDLKEIAKDYNSLVNELYTKINNIQKDGVIVSDSSDGRANQFIAKVNKDKPSTQALGVSMSVLGTAIILYANGVNTFSDTKVNDVN